MNYIKILENQINKFVGNYKKITLFGESKYENDLGDSLSEFSLPYFSSVLPKKNNLPECVFQQKIHGNKIKEINMPERFMEIIYNASDLELLEFSYIFENSELKKFSETLRANIVINLLENPECILEFKVALINTLEIMFETTDVIITCDFKFLYKKNKFALYAEIENDTEQELLEKFKNLKDSYITFKGRRFYNTFAANHIAILEVLIKHKN